MRIRSTFFRSALGYLGCLCVSGLADPLRDSTGLDAKIARVRSLPLAVLDRGLGAERLGNFLDATGEPGDQVRWREASGCGVGRLASEVCLEFLAEGELDTTVWLLIGAGLIDSGTQGSARVHRGEFHGKKLSKRNPLGSLRSLVVARNPEAHAAFTVVDIRNGDRPEAPFRLMGAASIGRKAQSPLRSAARLLDSLWKSDACGAPSDTFELKLLVFKRKRDGIDLVRLTHVDMYQDGSAISRLMSLGRSIAKAIPGDCALKLVRIGQPSCR